MSGDDWGLREALRAHDWESRQIILSARWESEQLREAQKWEISQCPPVAPGKEALWENVTMAKKDEIPAPEPEASASVPPKKRTVLASDAKKTTRPPKVGRRPCCP